MESSEYNMKLMSINCDFTSKCLNNPFFNDSILIVEGKEFPVSRFLLSMHSPFFEGVFKWNAENEKKDKIKLEEVKLKPFEIILNYMYTGGIELESTITYDELMELLQLGHFLGTHYAIEKIASYVTDAHIDDNTIVPLINAAGLYDVKILQNNLMKYLAPKINSFTTPEIFNTFNEDALVVILGCDELAIDERTLIGLVEQWLEVNTTTKREIILRKIRLTLLDNIEIIEMKQKNLFSTEQICESLCKKIINETEKYRYDPSRKARDIRTPWMKTCDFFKNYHISFLSKVIGRVELCIERLRIDHCLISLKEKSIHGVYENGRYVFTFEPQQADHIELKLFDVCDNLKGFIIKKDMIFIY